VSEKHFNERFGRILANGKPSPCCAYVLDEYLLLDFHQDCFDIIKCFI